jgi:putative phosphoribosyl transferase
VFRDRRDAGARLAERLAGLKGQDVLVLGIPRGGVPVADEIARRLGAELDVVVARKLGAPGQPELALGAVTANGGRVQNDELIAESGVPASYLAAVTEQQMAEARRRQERFRGGAPPPRVAGRTVLVVDDGLATGATMRAAVRSLRRQGAGRVVVAVPVGSREACAALRAEADEVVCLSEPAFFWAVGLHYEDFRPTEDDEVVQILQRARSRIGGATPTPAAKTPRAR